MPRGRKKRHDPDEAPIDGDYAQDQVLNRDPAKVYAWLSVEDEAKFKARGYTRVSRSPDGAHAAYDLGGESEGVYRNGQLVLHEVPRERHERIVAREQQIQDNQMAAINADIERAGGIADVNRRLVA